MKELEEEKRDEALAQEEPGGKMSFLEHLEELRKRLIRIVTYIGIGFVACWFFHNQIYHFLAKPILPLLKAKNVNLVILTPTQGFVVYMKVSFFASIFLTAPLLLHEVWKFISPALYTREKRYLVPFILSSLVLFLGGAWFAYKVVLPAALEFLLGIAEGFTPMITADAYFDMILTIILGFGLIFEMPVVVAFLSIFKLVTGGFLLRNFRYAILIIFILAAVLSPTPDAFTQCVYAAPMIVLYGVSILVAYILNPKRKKKD
jgi:sec-independent protein translocase protein TatC